jgi:hypothetical protein
MPQTAQHRKKPTLKGAIARCRRHIHGKGAKAHVKRAACIKRAKRRISRHR